MLEYARYLLEKSITDMTRMEGEGRQNYCYKESV